MDEKVHSPGLSKYNRHILNRILSGFQVDKEFNIYELVSESVSHKCILPSQNELIMETFYTIKEYLLNNSFVTERKEMTAYILTGKGIDLKTAGSIDMFEEIIAKKNKKTLLQTLLSKDTYKLKTQPESKRPTEYYE